MSVNARLALPALFSSSQAWLAFRTAVIVLLMDCGWIGLTGIDTSFAPIPLTSRFWFARFEWSEEPGNPDDPTASVS